MRDVRNSMFAYPHFLSPAERWAHVEWTDVCVYVFWQKLANIFPQKQLKNFTVICCTSIHSTQAGWWVWFSVLERDVYVCVCVYVNEWSRRHWTILIREGTAPHH